MFDYGSSRTDSPVPIVKSKGVESSGKDISKDGLSAGSFTQDIRANWLPECQILETTSVVEMDRKPEISVFRARRNSQALRYWQRPATNEEGLCGRGRGRERGRIVIGNPKKQAFERVIIWAQLMLLLPPRKENSTSDCGPMARSSSINDRNRGSCGAGNDDLMGIFNSVAENEIALVFRRRLDSQKRARYKKIIRRHMVLDTLQSRIASCAIVSVKELFRDLLLLANNALVFYSRRTREYKSALLLGDIVTKAYQQHCKDSRIQDASPSPSPIFPLFPRCNPPVKPSSVENVAAGALERCKKSSTAEIFVSGTQVCRNPSNTDSRPSMESLMMASKGFSWMGKVGRGMTNPRPKAPMKERKRARRR